jgi:hypothetical protein
MQRFRPSSYSGHYGDGEQVAIDTAKVSAATGVAGGTAVTGLLVAAGSVAAVPVAGWIGAGVLAAAAGTVALVASIKAGKARRKDAVALARKLKLPHPEKAPGYIVRVLKLKKSKRAKLLTRYKQRIARLSKRKSKLFAKARARRIADLKWKVAVLVAMAKIENPKKMTANEKKAARIVAAAPLVPPLEAVNEVNSPAMDPEQEDAVEGRAEAAEERADPVQGLTLSAEGSAAGAIPMWGWVVGGVAVLGVIVLASQGRSDRSHGHRSH